MLKSGQLDEALGESTWFINHLIEGYEEIKSKFWDILFFVSSLVIYK